MLDGSRSSCRWDTDKDAVVPGIFGPSHEPSLFRDDYVTNSNDSYWLANPKQRLEGFARIIGDERTARSLRTRLGLVMVEQGMPFSLRSLVDMEFNDRQYAGELFKADLVQMCKDNPVLVGTDGPTDVSGACPVLQAWDVHDNLDSGLQWRCDRRANVLGNRDRGVVHAVRETIRDSRDWLVRRPAVVFGVDDRRATHWGPCTQERPRRGRD